MRIKIAGLIVGGGCIYIDTFSLGKLNTETIMQV